MLDVFRALTEERVYILLRTSVPAPETRQIKDKKDKWPLMRAKGGEFRHLNKTHKTSSPNKWTIAGLLSCSSAYSSYWKIQDQRTTHSENAKMIEWQKRPLSPSRSFCRSQIQRVKKVARKREKHGKSGKNGTARTLRVPFPVITTFLNMDKHI